MTFNRDKALSYLKQADFTNLFTETLGWDHYNKRLPITVDGQTHEFRGVAEKRGVVALVLQSDTLPITRMRAKLESEVAKRHHENFIIFTDGREQVWHWALREPGRPIARRYHSYDPRTHAGESLLQKLEKLRVTLQDEEKITLSGVTARVRSAFDVERTTKKFYEQFRKQREAFEAFVSGIPNEEMTRWYVSVMLNRLMFVYFIQKKGFLDGDTDYLRNRMRLMSEKFGNDRFYSFYRFFLLRLFHDGLGRPHEDDRELNALIGRVPYLNGGIFQPHVVEQQHADIQISDRAFEQLFDFFDLYQWHLDDRPLRDDKEINPDVLGYIFEKYINQKQMGAYYTKEDITGYISQNTILPYLFDRAAVAVPEAFRGDHSVWAMTRDDPDRYIYEAVRKGTELPLPPEIAAGLGDVAGRGAWNRPAPEEFALPTEIWRETIARRQRCEAVRARLANGALTGINDFITDNLDIRQFAQDVIEGTDDAKLLSAFWRGLTGVSVLDPTCGSGAFLFAALGVLQPLYEAALLRMRQLLADADWGSRQAEDARQFGEVLQDVSRHPNETYYILKSIIINNLYGVDIMEEAVEIAKLRLFLKLASQLETIEQVEPLPDIDFNIRAGNTLVGYVRREEVRAALAAKNVGAGVQQARMIFGEEEQELAAIEERADEIDRLFGRFRQMQTAGVQIEQQQDFVDTKTEITERLQALEAELNRVLARQYGVDPEKPAAYDKWLSSHEPFHWFIEFYGILRDGGFDVIVGNPPYVEYSKVRSDYSILQYKTESCGNLYAYVLERSNNLLRNAGRCSMIVPLSGHSTERMQPLIDHVYRQVSNLHIMNLSGDANPSLLFPGVKFRLAIVSFSSFVQKESTVFTTKYTRWYATARDHLFTYVTYTATRSLVNGVLPKIQSHRHEDVLNKVMIRSGSLMSHPGDSLTYVHDAPVNWIRSHTFVPYFNSERDGEKTSIHLRPLGFANDDLALAATAILSSTTFFIWWLSVSDCYNIKRREIERFPFDWPKSITSALAIHSRALMEDFKRKAKRRVYVYRTTGRVEYDEIYVKLSKAIIDEVDIVLASYFGFTDEELDFIINYDIKYRMGDELADEQITDEA